MLPYHTEELGFGAFYCTLDHLFKMAVLLRLLNLIKARTDLRVAGCEYSAAILLRLD